MADKTKQAASAGGLETTPGRAYGRTLDLLCAVSESPDGVPAMEMVRRLRIPKSSFFLMLQHCRRRGFVSTADGVLKPGPVLLRAAFALVESFDLRRVARPYLETLSHDTRQDVYLGVRNGLHAIYVDVVEHADAVHVNIARGTPRPYHATAIGKLLLAFAPADLIEECTCVEHFRAVTPKTIVSRESLLRDLKQIRRRGFSVSDGEAIEGISAVAVPIRKHGETIAGISMPRPRGTTLEYVDVLVQDLTETARRIESALVPEEVHGHELAQSRSAG